MTAITRSLDTNGNSVFQFKANRSDRARGFSIQATTVELANIAYNYGKGDMVSDGKEKAALCEYVLKHGTKREQAFVRDYFSHVLFNQ